jgi:predicted N-acetyltransferase YhbS
MEWTLRTLAPEETYALRRAVSAEGRIDLPSMHHELDDMPGSWHLGVVDRTARVVAISSFYPVDCPVRPQARPAVQLQFMAVDPALRRRGLGSALMAEAIRRLDASGVVLLWAHARDSAIPFYERFGFTVTDGSAFVPASTGRPHHLILLDLGAPRRERQRATVADRKAEGRS